MGAHTDFIANYMLLASWTVSHLGPACIFRRLQLEIVVSAQLSCIFEVCIAPCPENSCILGRRVDSLSAARLEDVQLRDVGNRARTSLLDVCVREMRNCRHLSSLLGVVAFRDVGDQAPTLCYKGRLCGARTTLAKATTVAHPNQTPKSGDSYKNGDVGTSGGPVARKSASHDPMKRTPLNLTCSSCPHEVSLFGVYASITPA